MNRFIRLSVVFALVAPSPVALAPIARAQPAPTTRTAKEHEKLGRDHLLAHRYDEAIAELEAALAIEPTRYTVLISRGAAYAGKGDEQTAIATYAKYPATEPHIAEATEAIKRLQAVVEQKQRAKAAALETEALQQQASGAYDAAITKLLEAFKLVPDPRYLFAAGKAAEAKGDKQQAVALYKQYLVVAPQGERAIEAQQLVGKLGGDLGYGIVLATKRGELELSAKRARELAADAKRAVDDAAAAAKRDDRAVQTARLRDARELASKASAEADVAARAVAAMTEAAKQVGTPEALVEANTATELAATARRAADEAQALVARAPTPLAIDPVVTGAAEPARPGGGLRKLGLGVAAVGAASLVTGAVFGWQARDAANEISAADEAWTTELDDRVAEGETAQRRMYLFYGVGGGLFAVGAGLYYLGWRAGRTERRESTTKVAPLLTPSTAGFTIVGRF